ncbi:MAG: fluoride efflux transporter FluC [Planctomycetota bacterium]|jgi:CrcB protein
MSWIPNSWFPSPYVLVAIGGAAGSALRYGVGTVLASRFSGIGSMWGTGTVNVLGSFLLGCIAVAFGASQRGHPATLLLGVGLCGGFTTFSTFAMELSDLIQSRRWGLAAGYGLGSLACGWLAFVCGAWMAQRLSDS